MLQRWIDSVKSSDAKVTHCITATTQSPPFVPFQQPISMTALRQYPVTTICPSMPQTNTTQVHSLHLHSLEISSPSLLLLQTQTKTIPVRTQVKMVKRCHANCTAKIQYQADWYLVVKQVEEGSAVKWQKKVMVRELVRLQRRQVRESSSWRLVIMTGRVLTSMRRLLICRDNCISRVICFQIILQYAGPLYNKGMLGGESRATVRKHLYLFGRTVFKHFKGLPIMQILDRWQYKQLNYNYMRQLLTLCLPLVILICLTRCTSLSCDIGQYANTDLNVCLLCSTGCLACCDQNLCITCDNGYVLSSTSGLCLSCPPNCNTCDESLTCLACANSTTLQSGVCLSCPIGCSVCSSSTVCTTCMAQYYLVSNGCEPCPAGCTACSFSSGYTCTACSDTYYLSSPTCIACSLPCANCNGPTTCTSCQDAYFFVSATQTCSACPLVCATCSAYSSCTTCVAGYHLSLSNCVPCIAHCDTCSDSISCLTCSTNYSLTSNSTCAVCTLPCATCDPSGTCVACSTGYYLSAGTCYACISLCDTCTSSYLCSSCQTGYYFDGSSCTSCGTYCRQCSQTTGKCSKCLQGFAMAEGDCVLCTQDVCSCQIGSKFISLYNQAKYFAILSASSLLCLVFFF